MTQLRMALLKKRRFSAIFPLSAFFMLPGATMSILVYALVPLLSWATRDPEKVRIQTNGQETERQLPLWPVVALLIGALLSGVAALARLWSVKVRATFDYEYVKLVSAKEALQFLDGLEADRLQRKSIVPAVLPSLWDKNDAFGATHVMVERSGGKDGTKTTHVVELLRETKPPAEGDDLETLQMSFVFRMRRYIWQPEKRAFQKLAMPPRLELHEYAAAKQSRGLTPEECQERLSQYGPNRFDIPLPEFLDLFKQHLSAPFFVFQVFCVFLWIMDDMIFYSLFTLLMLLFFEGTVANQRLRNLQVLKQMGQKPQPVYVLRARRWMLVDSTDLVQGDVIAVGVRSDSPNHEFTVPCDCLLLRGSCVVNEAMLTGESTPLTKEQISGTVEDNSEESWKHHMLFSGTTVIQHTKSSTTATASSTSQPPEGLCAAYVLSTGFYSAQGKLLRTILGSAERKTANNRETLLFILFLLIFAISSACYVLIEGLKDEARSRYKLFLNCVLIITSVIPPELPMELTLAVNNSLLALQKMAIVCTEPFRLPLAGKVTLCCFDKTGTITSDKLVLRGVTGAAALDGGKRRKLVKARNATLAAQQVLASCHSLIRTSGLQSKNPSAKLRRRDALLEGVVGDPLEIAALRAVQWELNTTGERVSRDTIGELLILKRFRFSSARRCMTTISRVQGTAESYLVCCKGAPERVRELVKLDEAARASFDDEYSHHAHHGGRVLALALRQVTGSELRSLLGLNASRPLDAAAFADANRSLFEVDQTMEFAGLAVFECPIKNDSQQALEELASSLHDIIMITGDAVLTGCHVANAVGMTRKGNDGEPLPFLVLEPQAAGPPRWVLSHPGSEKHEQIVSGKIADLHPRYNLAALGSSLQFLLDTEPASLHLVSVFARSSPQHKELIVIACRTHGHTVLMCGDGTNDVGALKQADAGIALLNNGVKRPSDETKDFRESLKKQLDAPGVVQFGDASFASPFTSKTPSLLGICDIVRQGRCTLVTTVQMFKILAVNCMISAFSLSVLYLDGVKFGDAQQTVLGLMIAVSFLFISRSTPVARLAPRRPHTSVFTVATMLSIVGQFAVHLRTLWMVTAMSKAESTRNDEEVDPDGEFSPNLMNTAVFIVQATMVVTTFAVNYKGRPHMNSLINNRPLLLCLIAVYGWAMALANQVDSDLSAYFEMVPFSLMFQQALVQLALTDTAACFFIDEAAAFVFDR